MIETKVPMDIRSYKAKLIGPFTTRQLICGVIAAIIDAILVMVVIRPLGINLKIAIMALMIIDIPVFAFTLEPQGMTMEDYLKNVVIRNLIAPAKRKAISQLPKKKDTVYSPKEMKQSQKALKKLVKTHPEYKAYK